MRVDAVTLVCEGVPDGRDVRWLGLVLDELAEGRVRVVPAGSKADLAATVRGMREALTTSEMRKAREVPRVHAVRDRDFLRAELLGKGEPDGVYSLARHCLESYLLEPAIVEPALGLSGVEEQLLTLAERRFWSDVAGAALDAVGYELRRDRLHLAEEPANKAEATRIVKAKHASFVGDLAAKPLEVEALIDAFEHDMRSAPLWTRVKGKDLMKSFAAQLDRQALPGGDLEARLFTWCSENGPPAPLVLEVKRILERLG